jgi:hypothetical protein
MPRRLPDPLAAGRSPPGNARPVSPFSVWSGLKERVRARAIRQCFAPGSGKEFIMKRFVVVALLALLAPCVVLGQAPAPPPAPAATAQTAVEPAKFTDAQRWNRASSLGVINSAAIITLGKSKGMTIDEIGTWLGNQFAPSWARPRTPQQLFQGMNRNWASFPDVVIEVVKSSEMEVTFRVNRPYVRNFGDGQIVYGVTLAEYEQVNRTVNKMIAEWVGVDFESKTEGPWIITTLRKKQ